MKRASYGVLIAILGGVAAAVVGWPSSGIADLDGGVERDDLDTIAARAVAADPQVAARAIHVLRARGPEGLDALTRAHASALAALRQDPMHLATDEAARLRRAFDTVSGQRDGHASGLYWFTDLDAARAEAQRTGRLVLSLRLLGRLDEEVSCANSRFFRIVMYSDPALAAHLREHYVLHWSSERPVPRVDIDMGDGRHIVRTITGNSVHYVLDTDGRVIDALVGLYGPRQFLRALEWADTASTRCGWARPACLRAAHRTAGTELAAAWGEMTIRGGGEMPSWDEVVDSVSNAARSDDPQGLPSATEAMRLTVGKSMVETPLLNRLQRGGARAPVRRDPPSAEEWARFADLFDWGSQGTLSDQTRALLRLKTGREDVDEMAAALLTTARADGMRNEVLFRRTIHEWLADPAGTTDMAPLNARVYRELLLTPADDPWLGLNAPDLYDGLDIEVGPSRPSRP